MRRCGAAVRGKELFGREQPAEPKHLKRARDGERDPDGARNMINGRWTRLNCPACSGRDDLHHEPRRSPKISWYAVGSTRDSGSAPGPAMGAPPERDRSALRRPWTKTWPPGCP